MNDVCVLTVGVAALLLAGCSQQATTSQKATAPVAQAPAKPAPAAQAQPAPSSSAGTTTGSHGVVQNVRQAAKRAADGSELRNIAIAYTQYADANRRGPASINDIKDSLSSRTIEGLQDNSVYTVVWKLQNPSASTILAYATELDSFGTRLVAKSDGSVNRMTKEDFEKARASR